MIVIDGKPQGKARPRMNTTTGRAYTTDKTRAYENHIRYCFITQKGKKLDGPIKAKIIAYYEIPKSATKTTKEVIGV